MLRLGMGKVLKVVDIARDPHRPRARAACDEYDGGLDHI
jgi:hypothetical protein